MPAPTSFAGPAPLFRVGQTVCVDIDGLLLRADIRQVKRDEGKAQCEYYWPGPKAKGRTAEWILFGELRPEEDAPPVAAAPPKPTKPAARPTQPTATNKRKAAKQPTKKPAVTKKHKDSAPISDPARRAVGLVAPSPGSSKQPVPTPSSSKKESGRQSAARASHPPITNLVSAGQLLRESFSGDPNKRCAPAPARPAAPEQEASDDDGLKTYQPPEAAPLATNDAVYHIMNGHLATGIIDAVIEGEYQVCLCKQGSTEVIYARLPRSVICKVPMSHHQVHSDAAKDASQVGEDTGCPIRDPTPSSSKPEASPRQDPSCSPPPPQPEPPKSVTVRTLALFTAPLALLALSKFPGRDPKPPRSPTP